MRLTSLPLVAATTLLYSACGVECTLLPCPGLAVQLEGVIPPEYTVTLSSPDAESVSRTCNSASPCPADLIRFVGYAPQEVTVSIVGASGSVAVTVQPRYQTVYPNGPDCGGCRTATITIELG